MSSPAQWKTGPDILIDHFFNGQIKPWGIVRDRRGNLVQRFKVSIGGSIKNNVLTLDETFTYGVGDGVISRIWSIEKNPEGSLEG